MLRVVGRQGHGDFSYSQKDFPLFFFLALNLLFRIRFNFHTLNNVQLFASEKLWDFLDKFPVSENEQNCGGLGMAKWHLCFNASDYEKELKQTLYEGKSQSPLRSLSWTIFQVREGKCVPSPECSAHPPGYLRLGNSCSHWLLPVFSVWNTKWHDNRILVFGILKPALNKWKTFYYRLWMTECNFTKLANVCHGGSSVILS